MELYIHIPFCVKKCSYCDFLSAPASSPVQEAYMTALFRELIERGAEYTDRIVTSIFIGGGTPSILPASQIEALMEQIRSAFCVAEDAEVTIECNPGTADIDKLSAYRHAGINRLSIGLQSASNEELRCLGRIHTYEEFLECYHAARETGFQNINVDLMSALPGQSLASFEETVHKVLSLTPPPEHISAYSLIIEEETPFYAQYEEGVLNLPDEDMEREMYVRTKQLLREAGYERYEISNYARPGYECRHNIGYWTREEYLGLGIGAASLMDETRWSNGRDLSAYIENPVGVRKQVEALTEEEQMEETMFLGLRLTEGVSETKFRTDFGCSLEDVYGEVIEKNIAEELIAWRADGRSQTVGAVAAATNLQLHHGDCLEACMEDCHRSRHLALTDRGLDLANYVMAQFLFDA